MLRAKHEHYKLKFGLNLSVVDKDVARSGCQQKFESAASC